MPAEPFTPAELEAAAQARHPGRNADLGYYRRETAAWLDAVAPLIAARVRAEVVEEIAQALLARGRIDPGASIEDGAAIARAHRTTPDGDDHA